MNHNPSHLHSALLWILLATVGLPGMAFSQQADENTTKAALVYNFARYTDWPTESSKQENLRACVLGDDELFNAFQSVDGRKIGKQHFQVIEFAFTDAPSQCDLIYFGLRDRRQIALLLSKIPHLPILTVGELPDFTDHGGIINLYQSAGKIRFEVSIKAAKKAHLTISARLLQLARIIE